MEKEKFDRRGCLMLIVGSLAVDILAFLLLYNGLLWFLRQLSTWAV